MNELNIVYQNIKKEIDKRLAEFRALFESGSDKDVFKEMCFCMFTPQNNAQKAWQAVCRLDEQNLLENGALDEVSGVLREQGVRFHNHKASYMLKNRLDFYPNTKARISALMEKMESLFKTRNFLAQRVAGWGLKEASHFLRNIGFGESICILDRHILRRLSAYRVIETTDITPKTYFEIERKMIHFAESEGIPVDALDFALWYQEKKELFK
jgi:N-glycosylase/DNA lyase